MGMKQQTLAHLLIRRAEGTGNHYRPGIPPVSRHGALDATRFATHRINHSRSTRIFGSGSRKVLTHKTTGKEASPVTRKHYIVAKPIIARPVDKRIEMLDALDDALREILDLPHAKALPKPPKLLKAA